jgi:hypothetical protein
LIVAAVEVLMVFGVGGVGGVGGFGGWVVAGGWWPQVGGWVDVMCLELMESIYYKEVTLFFIRQP